MAAERPWPTVILRRGVRHAPDAIASYSILPEGREEPPNPPGQEGTIYVPQAQTLAELREAVEGPLRALIKGPTRIESQEARGLVEQAQELAQEALDAFSTLDQETETDV